MAGGYLISDIEPKQRKPKPLPGTGQWGNQPMPGWGNPQPARGGYWSTGYGGTQGGVGTPTGGGFGGGQGAYDALMDQQGRFDDNFGRGIGTLQGFGNTGMGSMLENWTGSEFFTPEEMQLQRNMMAELEAGSRENQMRTMRQRAAAGGSLDDAGVIDAESRIRAGSTARLQRGYNELAISAKEKSWQLRMQAAQMLMQKYGLDQQRAMQIADMWARKQEAAIAPPMGGGSGDPFATAGSGGAAWNL